MDDLALEPRDRERIERLGVIVTPDGRGGYVIRHPKHRFRGGPIITGNLSAGLTSASMYLEEITKRTPNTKAKIEKPLPQKDDKEMATVNQKKAKTELKGEAAEAAAVIAKNTPKRKGKIAKVKPVSQPRGPLDGVFAQIALAVAQHKGVKVGEIIAQAKANGVDVPESSASRISSIVKQVLGVAIAIDWKPSEANGWKQPRVRASAADKADKADQTASHAAA